MTSRKVQQYASGLWDAAGPLRRKSALVSLLLFKRICDVWEEESSAHAVHKEKAGQVRPSSAQHRVVVPANCSWSDLRRRPLDIGAGLHAAFRAIEEANPSMTSLLSGIDLSDAEVFPDSTFRLLFASFDRLRLHPSEVDEATFGGICDELMEKIMADAGRSERGSGTPRQVARLLAEILQPQEGMSIYDGSCGSGGMLLECFHYLKRLNKNHRSLRFYGQEIDTESWALCRINLFCHGVEAALIERGDTLRTPRLLTGDGRGLMTFDRVITHPPFDLREWGLDEWLPEDRYGRSNLGLPPKSGGDFAFLLHSMVSLNSRGMLGTVAPQGVLSRARDEGEIRRRVLQNDLVEAVVTVPRGGLSASSDPACLLILNKAKPRERRGNVLLVNGDQEPASTGSGLSDGEVDRISSAFRAWEDRDGLCRVVSLDEIERNDFILTVARYVPAAGAGPRADLASEWQILLKLIDERNEAERKLIEEIGRLQSEAHDA